MLCYKKDKGWVVDQAEAAEVRKESMASLSELSFLEKGRVQFCLRSVLYI